MSRLSVFTITREKIADPRNRDYIMNDCYDKRTHNRLTEKGRFRIVRVTKRVYDPPGREEIEILS